MKLKGTLRKRATWEKIGHTLLEIGKCFARGCVRLGKILTSKGARGKYGGAWRKFQNISQRYGMDSGFAKPGRVGEHSMSEQSYMPMEEEKQIRAEKERIYREAFVRGEKKAIKHKAYMEARRKVFGTPHKAKHDNHQSENIEQPKRGMFNDDMILGKRRREEWSLGTERESEEE